MKVLVIPDVHLKPFLFARAAELLQEGAAERAVCLMDIPDEWGQQNNLDLYIRTFDTAIEFARSFPETLWCYGNHDVSYLWGRSESGYSPAAAWIVKRKLAELGEALPDSRQPAFVRRIDRVLFSHGGISDEFVREHVPEKDWKDTDRTLEAINRLGPEEMWRDNSPIWFRPLYGGKLYQTGEEGEMLQVIAHTPDTRIRRKTGFLSCDVFSTDFSRRPIGTQKYPVIDTETLEWEEL